MRFIRWFAVIGLASAVLAETSPTPTRPVDQFRKSRQQFPHVLFRAKGVDKNKIRDNAVHFVIGFEHLPRESGSHSSNAAWNFTRWDLVDLSRFAVKLKAEFQGSNRDMYRPEAIVASSAR